MVLLLFGVASIVHFAYLAWQRSRGGGHPGKGFQISLLLRLVWAEAGALSDQLVGISPSNAGYLTSYDGIFYGMYHRTIIFLVVSNMMFIYVQLVRCEYCVLLIGARQAGTFQCFSIHLERGKLTGVFFRIIDTTK